MDTQRGKNARGGSLAAGRLATAAQTQEKKPAKGGHISSRRHTQLRIALATEPNPISRSVSTPNLRYIFFVYIFFFFFFFLLQLLGLGPWTPGRAGPAGPAGPGRKSTRLNPSHRGTPFAVFLLKKKNK